MQTNPAMALLLQEQKIDLDSVRADNSCPIWQKLDRAGRPYWGIADFWDLDQDGIPEDTDLSQLEWDGSELSLESCAKAEIGRILTKGIGIMKAWKAHWEKLCPETVFLILATYDNGDSLVNKADYPDGFHSLSLRFQAVRGENPVVNLTHFDEWEQPSILDICNKHLPSAPHVF